jgi:hypothetical protein
MSADNTMWKEHAIRSMQMFKEAGVEVEYYPPLTNPDMPEFWVWEDTTVASNNKYPNNN